MAKTLQEKQEVMFRVLDAVWNDSELQEAIQRYGEWNFTEMTKVFDKVKARHIEGATRTL